MRKTFLTIPLVLIGILVFINAYAFRTNPFLFRSGGGQGSAPSSWRDWGESDETGWGDAANTYIALMTNTTAGGNETGAGAGLTGADLVLTCVGALSGATGTPLYRQFDGVNDGFTFTEGLAGVFKQASKQWTVIMKWKDVTTRNKYLQLQGAAGSDSKYVELFESVTKLYGAVGIPASTGATTDDTPISGNLYLCLWSDGSKIRIGFSSTKPTKWSDFEAGKRKDITSVVSVADFSATTFATGRTIGIHNDLTSDPVAGKLHYVIFSKSVLIDNAS